MKVRNIVVLAVIAVVLFALAMRCREKYGPIKSLRNIPKEQCERMCDTIYPNVQYTGGGMGPDLAYNRVMACKAACHYSKFQRAQW